MMNAANTLENFVVIVKYVKRKIIKMLMLMNAYD